MKPVKKKRILLIFAMITIALAIFIYHKAAAYQVFLTHREIAISHVENTYEFKARIIDERMGKNAYPIGRESDCFVFYNENDKLYFKIYVHDKDVADYYTQATPEKPDLD